MQGILSLLIILNQKINIKEINEKLNQSSVDNIFYKKNFEREDIERCDHLVVADIEHQNNPALNLLQLSNFMKDEARIIIISKNFFGCLFLMFSKLFLVFHLEKIIFYHLLIYLIYILVVILK